MQPRVSEVKSEAEAKTAVRSSGLTCTYSDYFLGELAAHFDGIFARQLQRLIASYLYTPGTFLYSWGRFGRGDNEFICPRAIVVDNEGHVFVADGRKRIMVFLTDGTM